MSEWISVNEDIPPLDGDEQYSTHVLATYKDEIGIAYICWDDCIFDDDGNLDITCDLKSALSHGWGYWVWCEGDLEGPPTHWMSLPQLPDEQTSITSSKFSNG